MLPDGYKRRKKIDLQHNKKTALFVNLLSLQIFAVFLIPLFFIKSVPSLIKGMLSDASTESLTAAVFLCGGIILYLIAHELTHGLFMKIFGKAKVKFGITGFYAYTASMAYFNKRSYIITALAPVVIWSMILIPCTVLTYLYSSIYFQVFYILEGANLAGSAGDMYMAVRIGRMEKNVLIKDSGTDMIVYGTHVDTYGI